MVLAMHCFLQDISSARLPSAVAENILGEAEVWSACGHPMYII